MIQTNHAHWILKRNDNQATLTLHPQYMWIDEYDWQALAQSDPVYTLTGAMDIQQGSRRAGRPITLDAKHARIRRTDIKTLQAWADTPELTLTLSHPDGRKFAVIFARPALSNLHAIKPHRPIDEDDSDVYQVNVHLLTIE